MNIQSGQILFVLIDIQLVQLLKTSEVLLFSFETIVSDNATCFMGDEFQAFMTSNGIKYITSAPQHWPWCMPYAGSKEWSEGSNRKYNKYKIS